MCQTTIENAISWLRDRTKGNSLQFYLTSNEATLNTNDTVNNIVSYTSGILDKYQSGEAFWGILGQDNIVPYHWEKITGNGYQTFNDRNNFSLSQSDTMQLSITLATPGPNASPYNLSIELTLVTWGYALIHLTGFQCQEGILFGHADGTTERNGNNKVGYTLTFSKVTILG